MNSKVTTAVFRVVPSLACASIFFAVQKEDEKSLLTTSTSSRQNILVTECESGARSFRNANADAVRAIRPMKDESITRSGIAVPTKLIGSSQSFNFVADAAEKVLPAVVRVEVEAGPAGSLRGSGSGFVVNAKDVIQPKNADKGLGSDNDNDSGGMYVLTNAHCVLTPEEFHKNELLETDKQIFVEMKDNRRVLGWIVAFDVDKDVACIETFDQHELIPSSLIALDEQRQVRHGEFVLALGAPLRLESSVTVGIVSNPNRNVGDQRYIQTDATIHIGNSGGPLANIDGQIIGINSLKIAEGITYAIPIHEAIATIRKSMENNLKLQQDPHSLQNSNGLLSLASSTPTQRQLRNANLLLAASPDKNQPGSDDDDDDDDVLV